MPKVMAKAKASQRRMPVMRNTAYPASALAKGITSTYRLKTTPVSLVNSPTKATNRS